MKCDRLSYLITPSKTACAVFTANIQNYNFYKMKVADIEVAYLIPYSYNYIINTSTHVNIFFLEHYWVQQKQRCRDG